MPDLRDTIARVIWERHYAGDRTYPSWDAVYDPTKPIAPFITPGEEMIIRTPRDLYAAMQYVRDTADAVIAMMFYDNIGIS